MDENEAYNTILMETNGSAKDFIDWTHDATEAIENETEAINLASIATGIFHKALSTALNIGVALALSKIIQLYNDYTHAAENAKKALDEKYNDAKRDVESYKSEQRALNTLIEKYEQFESNLDLSNEQRQEIISMQEELNQSYADEAKNIDLINGKYDDELKKLKDIYVQQEANNSVNVRNEYDAAKERASLSDYGSYIDIATFQKNDQRDQYIYKFITDYFEGIDSINFERVSGLLESQMVIDTSDIDKVYDALTEIERRINIIESNPLAYNDYINTDGFQTFKSRIDELYQDISERRQDVESSAYERASNLIKSLGSDLYPNITLNDKEIPFSEVTTDIYKTWRDELIKQYASNDPVLQKAIDKYLNTVKPSKEWKAALEYGSAWPLWIEQEAIPQLKESFVTFNSQFDEQIDQVQEKAKELQSALSSIDSNSFDADTMTDFFQKFPDLAQYANDTTKLRSEIIKLMAENPKELIDNLTKFKNALPDEADQVKVQGIIDNLNALGMLSIDDEVKRVIDDFGNLKSAAEKLENGEYEASDLQALFESFPELRKYSGDISKLTDKTRELAETEASDLLLALNTLRETTTDPEVLAGINAWIASISRLSFTTNSLLEYETSKIDDIIEGIEDQNEKLQEQLDIINEMIEGYETAASMVQTYVDEQVQALEDEKQAIEDDYNAQIKAIQDKNKEREQEINLQEKLDALLNARKKKVNVYSETNGWKLQRNSTAIEEAKREYEQARDEKQIADLEKQRDAATEGFEERIKAWNDYGDEWSKAIDKVKNAAAYEKADEILGEDWREAANRKDKTLLNNVITNYNDYLNKRKPKVEAEIKENDKLIKNYESLKDEMNKMLDTTKTKTNEYLDSLMKIAPSELDSYEKRQQYLKNFCAAMDQILEDSSYGSWLIGKEDKVIDDATLNAAQQVVFQNGKLLYDAILNDESALKRSQDKLYQATYGALTDRNNFKDMSKTYTSSTSNVFNFSGDIKTNNPLDFMNGLNSLIKQGRLDSMVGK